jgi:hypothetical protein
MLKKRSEIQMSSPKTKFFNTFNFINCHEAAIVCFSEGAARPTIIQLALHGLVFLICFLYLNFFSSVSITAQT